MSGRSILFLRTAILEKSFMPVARPIIRLPLKPNNGRFLSKKPTRRFYGSTSTEKQQQNSKISSIVSSPSIIQAAKTEPKQSKLKELARKYGMAGIVVYLAVGCVDLGITFGVIQLAGLDKVRAIEKSVINTFYNVGERIGFEKKVDERPVVVVTDGENNTLLTAAVANEEIDLIKNNNNDTPSFASVFILAYGIHKTLLLPIRLGITAAITPAVVRKLHQMGWARYFPKLLGATKPKNL